MQWTPRSGGLGLSALVHLGALLGLGVVAIFWPEPFPDPAVPGIVVGLDPGAIAAVSLLKGNPSGPRRDPIQPTRPDPPPPQADALIEPAAQVEPVELEASAPAVEAFGSETGDPSGSADGIEGGVPDGSPFGIPGGDPRGCVGCTGAGPVLDYDQGPRLLQSTRPVYPHDAFMQKIEGVVTVQFLIDATGVVGSARVIRSVPLLDEAAIASVRQWRFAPAVKKGRPVPALATAPVSFRIF